MRSLTALIERRIEKKLNYNEKLDFKHNKFKNVFGEIKYISISFCNGKYQNVVVY